MIALMLFLLNFTQQDGVQFLCTIEMLNVPVQHGARESITFDSCHYSIIPQFLGVVRLPDLRTRIQYMMV